MTNHNLNIPFYNNKERLMKYIALLALAITLSGCTVGRYVTNVSSRGPGKIAIEKCTTKAYGNFYWNEECGETTLTLPTPSAK